MHINPDDLLWYWGVCGVVLVLAETLLPGFVSSILGLSALTVAGLLAIGWLTDFESSLLCWFILSIIYIFSIRIIFAPKPSMEKNFDSLDEDKIALGETVSVTEEVSFEHSKGRIYFRGTWWNARSLSNRIFRPGETVRLVGKEGTVWIVEET
jgi:membrane protein implicated in regulation of membrane protease activity